ncbi:hypothetical protein FOCG_12983 [Fusarium oxysporum f. sp. radicis-lycopersici 26381]|nr:hypothetical protein FOCG_12983 [Fusarium oxysporum f. sp. radicis-lycopersici 26381]
METTYNHKTYHSQLQAHRRSFIASLQVEALYLTKPGAITLEPEDWAMISEGNVDLYNLQNFSAVSFYD